ncbi:hypothetical protein [Polaribacter sp.]|uniref:hypothetical protein n=1 Tax=Polaribacter sp. TaxID=1920175 RepID=UPI003EF752C5
MIKKLVKDISFILILLSHLGFLAAILYEKQQNIYISVFVILVIVLLIFRYKKTSLKAKNHDLENVLTVGFVFFGAIITYVLSAILGIGSVLSASIVGLVASFVPAFFKKNNFIKGMPTAVYCGSFVGMTNVNIAPDYIFIALASVISGFLLVGTKDTFHGIGGKLGTLAFGGVALAFFITFLLSKWL